jgi:hypothetical protein
MVRIGSGTLSKVGITETAPTDSSKTNASYVLSYNAGGELVRVDKTIGTTTYRKAVTPISGDTTITNTKSFAAWVAV